MKTSSRKFGQNVRALRLEMNWTQEDLAKCCDLDRTYISGIERGVRNPSLSIVYKIAAALKVHPSRLFENGPRT